jgi:hypothetical protein
MRKVILCLVACMAAGSGAFAQVGILADDPQGDTEVTPIDLRGNEIKLKIK